MADATMDRTDVHYVSRPTEIDVYETQVLPVWRSVSWGAILCGVVIALVVQFAMNLLGLSIGANTINPAYEANPIEPALNTAAVLWIAGSTVLALFAGGWTAGRLAGTSSEMNSVLHGLVTWGLVTLISLVILTSAVGGLISGLGRAVGQGLSLVASGAVEAVPAVADSLTRQNEMLGVIGGEVRGMVDAARRAANQPVVTTTGEDGELTAEELRLQATQIQFDTLEDLQFNNRLMAFLNDGPEDETARQEMVTLLAERTGLSQQEASARLDQWQQTYIEVRTQAEETAREVGQAVTDTLAAVSGILFAAMVAGAFAAGVGGYAAVVWQDNRRREGIVRH
jgi:hypothetical protein